MRKPETIERLYLGFDGFFASVEQQCHRGGRCAMRVSSGRPHWTARSTGVNGPGLLRARRKGVRRPSTR
jgi:hypothetical protein